MALEELRKKWKAERKAKLRSKLICVAITTGFYTVSGLMLVELAQKTFPDLFTKEEVKETKEIEETSAYVNMDDVVSFEANGNSLYLHFSDGTGYYYEPETETDTETVQCNIINQQYCDAGTDFSVEMPNGEVHVFHTFDTVNSDAKTVCFKVATENKNDYTQYEIVSFE